MSGNYKKTSESLSDKPALPVSRYLKYAIGEIILVVIGILIALSINNWNENRKNESIKKKYLLALSSEIENNLSVLKSRKSYTEKRLSDVHYYLKMVSQTEVP
jgi:sensor domain CHASE-containing protein